MFNLLDFILFDNYQQTIEESLNYPKLIIK